MVFPALFTIHKNARIVNICYGFIGFGGLLKDGLDWVAVEYDPVAMCLAVLYLDVNIPNVAGWLTFSSLSHR